MDTTETPSALAGRAPPLQLNEKGGSSPPQGTDTVCCSKPMQREEKWTGKEDVNHHHLPLQSRRQVTASHACLPPADAGAVQPHRVLTPSSRSASQTSSLDPPRCQFLPCLTPH